MHTRFSGLILALVAALSVVSFALAQHPEVSAAPGKLLLSGDSLISHVRWLADDARRGRATGDEGADAAAVWLAGNFSRLGLVPAGDDGSFYQEYEATVGVLLKEGNRLSLGDETFTMNDDFIPFGFSESGTVENSPLIFVGYGITDEDNDFDEYAGVDVEGKTVVILRHEPQIDDPNSVFAGDAFSRHAAFRAKAENARDHGAAAMVLITGPRSEQYEEDELTALTGTEGMGSGGLLAVHAKHALMEPVFVAASIDLEAWTVAMDESLQANSFPLNATLNLTTELVKDRRTTRNVVALLPGTDPEAGYIVVGAHYDHLGFGGSNSLAPESKGTIHNGADDNASGAGALVELARVFQITHSLEQGLIFVGFSGEEIGLLGSAHFVDNPYVPLDEVQVMINMDMIGRPQKNTVTVGGVGSSPEFHPLMDKLEDMVDLEISRDSSGFGASDHTSFYVKDVPVLFFFSGLHEDYHRPSDDWDKIDKEGYLETVRLVHAAILDLGNRPQLVEFTQAAEDSLGPHGGNSSTGGGGGYGPYLGTIPSFGDREDPGVELTGVRSNSPADKAGIQGGDVVIRFGDKDIIDLYAYTYALRDHKPGDVVEIVVLRDGEEVTLTATLGKRE